MLDGILHKYLYRHCRQIDFACIYVGGNLFPVLQLVGHLPAFYLHIIIHKPQLLLQRGLQHVSLVNTPSQQLRQCVQVHRPAFHLFQHLMVQCVIDEMWCDAVSDVLHAEADNLLPGSHFLQTVFATTQLVEHYHHHNRQHSHSRQCQCQLGTQLLMVYLLLLLHALLVMLILVQLCTHAHGRLCCMYRVVQSVQFFVDAHGLLPTSGLPHQLFQRLQSQHLSGRNTDVILGTG